MKKLRMKRNFKPLPIEGDDELYPNGIFHFNITKLASFIKDNPGDFPINNVKVDEVRIHVSDQLDEDTIEKADITKPIILAEISPERFNVIDGNHRLEKAYRTGRTHIPAYRVGPDKHVAFLKTEMTYRTYVKYWNQKVDERI